MYGLRITTPRLELRLPDLQALEELAAVAAAGVHDEARMPFTVPWTAASPRERARATFQHVLGTLAEWHPHRWKLSLAVLTGGRVIGRQDLSADDFPVTREAQTGSWLGLAHHGRGFGTEMRAAVLHLAFAGLGAHSVTSAAMTDNPASLRVSEKLGYAPDGLTVTAVQGRSRTLRRLRLDRAAWTAHRTVPVEVHGLDTCRDLFGR
ncbi:GCN5 family acetyltransferase [Streptomyces sp. NRRL F-4489]|nr:GCN5 family acetyltransferase [Streptomyces sp. NRRL F-4489]